MDGVQAPLDVSEAQEPIGVVGVGGSEWLGRQEGSICHEARDVSKWSGNKIDAHTFCGSLIT